MNVILANANRPSYGEATIPLPIPRKEYEHSLELLRQMEGETVITKPAHGKGIPILEAEARYTDLYALCFPTVRPSGMEWTKSPVVLP